MEMFNAQQILPSISSRISVSKEESLTQKLQGPNAIKSGSDLEKTTQDFESVMLHKMLESMRKTVPKSGLFQSFSTDMFESMMDQEIAQQLAKRGGIGLGKMLYLELSKKQALLEEAQLRAQHTEAEPQLMFTSDLQKDK